MPQGDSASNATQAAEEPGNSAVQDKVEHAKKLIEKQRMKKEKEERQVRSGTFFFTRITAA